MTKKLVIGVLTARRYEERRQAVLTTWGRDALARPDVDLVFLIGDPSLKLPRRDGLSLYLPCPDDYESLPQKTRWFCLWALANSDAPWLLKCDDDSYVHINRLLTAADSTNWSQPVIGCCDGNGDHWHGGAGYLMRRDAALSIAAYLEARTGLEDWRARDAVASGGMWFEHDGRFCFDRSRMPLPGNDQITCHYCTPVRMRLIHDEHRQPDAPVTIPRVLHQIWLGSQPIPKELNSYRDSWLRQHPGWRHKLWTEDNFGPLTNQRQFDAARTPAQKCQIARFEILHREGGVYADFDVECRKPIDDLLPGLTGFAGAEDDGTIGVAVLGAMPGDPLLARVIKSLPDAFANGFDPPHQSGSWFFTPHLLADETWRLFWWEKFYPIHYTGRAESPVEQAYGVHHWAAAWRR
jgi:hypothetical protein